MNWIAIAWRGLLMGVVEVLPGISGGTVALLTSIYERLINALSKVQLFPSETQQRNQWITAAGFLVQLGLWMVVGFITAMFVVLDVVESQPMLFWGVVFGIVIGASVALIRLCAWRDVLRYAPIGLLVGLPIVALPSWSHEPPMWLFFVGGASAFSAWLLPGISGSMVLLLLGLWLPTLEALSTLAYMKIGLFVCGILVAFFILPRVIRVVIERYRDAMQGFFIGLILSTLYRAWPWRSTAGVPELMSIDAGGSQFFMIALCVLVGCVGVLIPMLRMSRDVG